jgi:hypothetical protein
MFSFEIPKLALQRCEETHDPEKFVEAKKPSA